MTTARLRRQITSVGDWLQWFLLTGVGDSDEFYGVYADIRETRDRKYHGNYTQERQLWQDEIIRLLMLRV